MNKGQKVLAGLLGVVAVELAVVDFAAVMLLMNGVTIEVTADELKAAEEVFETDLAAEGGELLEENE